MIGRMGLAAVLLAGTALAALPVRAQTTGTPGASATAIKPDGSTRTAIQGSENGTIVIGGGSIAGDNLFHSFAHFDLSKGETAAWVGPGSIANVINRVTGNAASHIDGTIDTTAMPLAAFWFINPNGVLFGEGAAFNVPGAMHFSTASELKFADGAVFSARTPGGSTLSMAAPASFGFLGGEADIALLRVGNDPAAQFESGLPAASRLTLVAPGVSIDSSGLLLQEANFIAAGSAISIPVGADALPLLGGQLAISGSDIIVTGGGTASGTSRLAGGSLVISESSIGTRAAEAAGNNLSLLAAQTIAVDSSVLTSRTSGAGSGGALTLASSGAILLSSSTLASDSQGDASGDGGAVRIDASGALNLEQANVAAFSEGNGNGGDIGMTAGGDLVATSSNLLSQSLTPGSGGDGGDINLFAVGKLTMSGSTLAADTSGEGAGGQIFALSQGSLRAMQTTFTSNTLGVETSGKGGLVSIGSAADVTLDKSIITAASLGNGDGGTVFVNAGTDLAMGASSILSQSVSETGTGAAGSILLHAARDIALSGTDLTADTYGFGPGGNISVNADRGLSIAGGAISSDTLGEQGGFGGFVFLNAGGTGNLTDTIVSTDTFGDGLGGSVRINGTGGLTLVSSTVSADTVGERGRGGFVFVTSGVGLQLTDSRVFADTYAGGVGGDVLLRATGPISVAGGYISAESRSRAASGGGSGGSVFIEGSGAVSLSGARVSTDTFGSGDAGLVKISTPGKLTLANGTTLVSETIGSGLGGVVSLVVDELALTNATIAANTDGAGNSLGVLVSVRKATIGQGGLVTSASTGAGDAGLVYIGGDAIDLTNAELVSVVDGGSVTASATGTGAAGNVRIQADRLEVLRGGEITTSSSNAHPAGVIFIDAGNLLVDGVGADRQASRIISENLFAGTVTGGGNAGGDILINTAAATISNGGQLNTNSNTGNAGFIGLDFGNSRGILRLSGKADGGTIRTNSKTGSGGQIAISGAYAIIADGSEISASGDVSNAFVTIDPLTVRINSTDNTNIVNVSGLFSVAPEQDVGSTTTVVEVPFLDAAKVLEGRCAAARSQGRASRLNIQDLGPYSLTLREDDALRRVAANPSAGRTCL